MQTVTLPDLQASLPKLAQSVLDGEWFLIPVGTRNMVLRLADEEEASPPMREPGYFADCLDDESIELDNVAAQQSPQSLVP